MSRFLAGFLVLSITVVSGCGDKGTPGGPGANTPNNNKPVMGTADATFTLDVPNLSTTIKQQETQVISIEINRGKNFDQDVTLKFENLPKGVTASPASPVIGRGQEEAKFNLTASADAALGEFVIKVHGTPTTGAQAHNEFKVNVDKP